MFHSAALKLTLWYLSIIMLLSISCSVVIYNLADDQLANNTRRQVYFFNDQLNAPDFDSFANLRHKQLADGENRLRNDLAVFNILVLIVGGVISYELARRTLRPIEDALESQTRFTGDASHELRTPLTAMQTEIEVALRDKNLTIQQAVELLNSNLEEVAKLKALAEGLLALASTDGKAETSQPVSIKKIVGQSIDRVSKTAEAKSIKIINEIKDVKMAGNPESLVQMVSIILDNAVKYSPAGSKVKITSGKHDKTAFISITDEGQGIKAIDLPHIFDRFYRADSSRSKEQADGYGLGLAIAKKISDLHNGHIEVKSTPGKGSTFTIFLSAA